MHWCLLQSRMAEHLVSHKYCLEHRTSFCFWPHLQVLVTNCRHCDRQKMISFTGEKQRLVLKSMKRFLLESIQVFQYRMNLPIHNCQCDSVVNKCVFHNPRVSHTYLHTLAHPQYMVGYILQSKYIKVYIKLHLFRSPIHIHYQKGN